jgi:hypothetical protein
LVQALKSPALAITALIVPNAVPNGGAALAWCPGPFTKFGWKTKQKHDPLEARAKRDDPKNQSSVQRLKLN